MERLPAGKMVCAKIRPARLPDLLFLGLGRERVSGGQQRRRRQKSLGGLKAVDWPQAASFVSCLAGRMVGPSRSFVRVWHHPAFDEETHRPLLLMTYRLALERLVPDHAFAVHCYDAFARERVESVSIDWEGCLRVGLKKDPLVAVERSRKPVYCHVERIEQRLLVVTLGLACSLSPEDDVVSFQYREPSRYWVSDVDLREPRQQETEGSCDLRLEWAVQFSHQALKNSDELDSLFDFP